MTSSRSFQPGLSETRCVMENKAHVCFSASNGMHRDRHLEMVKCRRLCPLLAPGAESGGSLELADEGGRLVRQIAGLRSAKGL